MKKKVTDKPFISQLGIFNGSYFEFSYPSELTNGVVEGGQSVIDRIKEENPKPFYISGVEHKPKGKYWIDETTVGEIFRYKPIVRQYKDFKSFFNKEPYIFIYQFLVGFDSYSKALDFAEEFIDYLVEGGRFK